MSAVIQRRVDCIMQIASISTYRPSEALFSHLGNYAKYFVAQNPIDASNDAVSDAISKKKKSVSIRALRYEMQDTARKLLRADLGKLGPIDIKSFKGPYRLVPCRHVRVSAFVGLNLSLEHGKAFYTGLATCGSVWSCPVCSSIIQERRRKEVCKAIDSAYSEGLTCSMLTLTFPHYSFNSCVELLEKQKSALAHFRSTTPYRSLKKRIGYIGLIRGLEVVYGSNGWHPHTHEIWFHDKGKSKGLLFTLKRLWFNACSKFGLIPKGKITAFKKYAVDLRLGANSGDYLAKSSDESYWGADSELVRSSLKNTAKGLPPFALLESANCSDDSNSLRNGRLYVEYVKAFVGKSQLFWSKGMKDRYLIEDKSDETLATESVDKSIELGLLNSLAWEIIRKNKARDLVLYLLENGGFETVIEWLRLHGVNSPLD